MGNKITPITFSDAMHQQVLAGKKTCTSRLLKPQPDITSTAHCRYGLKGDYLYIKENHWIRKYYGENYTGSIIVFKDGEYVEYINNKLAFPGVQEEFKDGSYLAAHHFKRQAKLYFPKHAGRYILQLTSNPIVKQVQYFTEAECLAEGVPVLYIDAVRLFGKSVQVRGKAAWDEAGLIGNWRWLWNTIYAKWKPVWSTVMQSNVDNYVDKVTRKQGGKHQYLDHFLCHPWCEEDTPKVSTKAKARAKHCAVVNPYVHQLHFHKTGVNMKQLCTRLKIQL